jgi:DNA-binding SARP family transcriptional activator
LPKTEGTLLKEKSRVPQQRQHLAFLFWPDTTEAQARNNLRQLLHQLRQVFPEALHFLSADMHMLHCHPVTPCHLDVAKFEEALTLADAARRRNDQHALQAALEQADNLYRGELLPGCYEEWILPEREQLLCWLHGTSAREIGTSRTIYPSRACELLLR